MDITNNMTSLPEERGWEYKQITVTRVPGYGFGIAVSGGRDNPHFASGDPSIAVSDVLVSGPAERTLQVNDRIISVNGISLQNVDYATAVQVLRDSGDTVSLVIKRRVATHQHQHSHSLSASYSNPPTLTSGIQPSKITLTKNSKKEDFGIVLGCKLFVKEISSKARDQLLATNQYLAEGDFISKINNTNCNDMMSLKEAKKIIDSCKDKLSFTIARDITNNASINHQPQSSVSTTGAVNNYYKGDDYLTNQSSYSNQNLYVQPPTRNPNLNSSSYNEEKTESPMSPGQGLLDDKSNLAPRGRLRGPLSDANLSQLDRDRGSIAGYGKSKRVDEPPRPPPPRAEDYYSSRRQLYEEDPLIQKSKQSVPDARFITFQKEGSVGIRLTGGNYVGIFVTAVQPGSPASLQGLQPGDKILKVNDMDMTGVTREEAVLFLLSLQDRIELIVQYCKEEYENIVASQKGDSFYIKTHFHYDNPAKGEMTFRSGDIFHVIDTLYNGVVGCWQVFRIGRNNQEVQKGIIPNKARAEELATAQFNATKKEMSANESRGSFFRRRRSSSRRSKSLGKEHWDDILFSDCVSKFPAYERVILKHPGFTRPVILFGPIADMARDKMLKDFPDKFISPQLETGNDENKTQKSSNIIRLSAIRDVISTGKHALLDITPNAVERLNYAQLYPIVVFFKAETKIIVKQLRQGLPKSAHKSSKKLLEQCQKLDKVWGHIFSSTITLNDNSENWYRKVRELIDKQQTSALWMSESKPEESLSDDFLFPMSSLRLSYASSPESDVEHSPGPPVNHSGSPREGGPSTGGGRLTKASSDPSVVMPDNSTNDVLPPYQPNYDTRYGFNSNQNESHSTNVSPVNGNPTSNSKDQLFLSQNQLQSPSNPENTNDNLYKASVYSQNQNGQNDYGKNDSHKRQSSNLHGHFTPSKSHNMNDGSPMRGNKEGMYGTNAPDLPPRVDRTAKPASLSKATSNRTAHERLFPSKTPQPENSEQQTNGNGENPNFVNNKLGSLDRHQNSKTDSMSSYDSFNTSNLNKHNSSQRPSIIGPNAHDDLKSSIPKNDIQESNPRHGAGPPGRWDGPPTHRHDHSRMTSSVDHLQEFSSPRNSQELDRDRDRDRELSRPGDINDHRVNSDGRLNDMYRYPRSPSKPQPPKHIETKTDYGKYSRNNSSAQDYARHSHQDLTQAHLSIHQSSTAHHHSPMKSSSQLYSHSNGHSNPMENGNNQMGTLTNSGPPNSYKPVPPPKPKNYKPPFPQSPKSPGGYNENMNFGQPTNGGYQHGKSHSNPVNDQRSPNYYYNMPPSNDWHTETAVRYNSNMHGHYDMSNNMSNMSNNMSNYEQRRHASISYPSRNDIMQMSPEMPPYRIESNDNIMDNRNIDGRPNLVDLQGSREQRGSAFELYRKPVHHNMSASESNGSQLSLANSEKSHSSTQSVTNQSQKSFDDQNDETKTMETETTRNIDNDNHNRDMGDRCIDSDSYTIDLSKNEGNRDHLDNEIYSSKIKRGHLDNAIYSTKAGSNDNQLDSDSYVTNLATDRPNCNDRDMTTAIVDHRGALLVNQYWGVSLEIPENALPKGVRQEIYFVISDPRLCENAPPLDFENGETMLSPLVMCGPQGIEFQKPVILNIPHYANTLPSLSISLKATDSESNLHTEWDNILLPSNHAANSVAVKVDHF